MENSKIDSDNKALLELLRIIIREDLGKVNPRSFRGYGAVQPSYVRSKKQMLGMIEDEEDSEKPKTSTVKISRAFLKDSD